jgi:hypothetical protein
MRLITIFERLWNSGRIRSLETWILLKVNILCNMCKVAREVVGGGGGQRAHSDNSGGHSM